MKIDKEAFQEIIDRVRHPLYFIREDINDGKITQETKQNIQSVFDFIEEMKSAKTGWEIWSE